MTLSSAPFRQRLRIQSLSALSPDHRLVLVQMGLGEGDELEKLQVAPLGDPVSLRIGTQVFTLRREVTDQVAVEVVL